MDEEQSSWEVGADEIDQPPISQAPVTIGYTRISAHRIGDIRHSSSPPPPENDVLRLVADLLLAAASADGELEDLIHLYLLNRGIVLTPFHNMALMSPVTTTADADRHHEVFSAAIGELVAG